MKPFATRHIHGLQTFPINVSCLSSTVTIELCSVIFSYYHLLQQLMETVELRAKKITKTNKRENMWSIRKLKSKKLFEWDDYSTSTSHAKSVMHSTQLKITKPTSINIFIEVNLTFLFSNKSIVYGLMLPLWRIFLIPFPGNGLRDLSRRISYLSFM